MAVKPEKPDRNLAPQGQTWLEVSHGTGWR